MKKLLCLFLVGTSFLMTGCHEHTWTDATCTQPMTCEGCGETMGDTLEHTWIEADCTHPKYCEVCNEKFGTAIPHIWAGATCLKPETCTKCGETQGEVGSHKWTDATCYQPKTCERCYETEGTSLEHNFENKYCTRCKVEDPNAVFLDDFGYINNYGMTKWIQIDGYNLNDGCVYIKNLNSANSHFYYIILEDNIIRTIDNRALDRDVLRTDNTFILETFSNDRIKYSSYESLIYERVCKDDMLILKVARASYEEWYVPVDLLDMENVVRKVITDSNEIEFEYYYFYFK